MKLPITATCLLLTTLAAQGKPPVLNYNTDRQLKIAQFTDMHLDGGTPARLAEAEKTFGRLSRIITSEQPDLLIFTGDIVTGKPAASMWQRLLDSVTAHRLPFCVVLGNHDAEQDLTRPEIARLICACPMTLNTLNAQGELADLALTIQDKNKPSTLLYCMDSHDYSQIAGIDGYGWFSPEQIGWYRTQSARFKAGNGNQPLPALAFFHIALPEYSSAWRDRHDNTYTGRAAEEECPGAVNAGMFAAMVESGDVMGCFVGHDHDIDYIVTHHGIALGYGRFSGDKTTYNNLRHGIRLLQLTAGKRSFETWIREDDGAQVDRVKFDNGVISKVK